MGRKRKANLEVEYELERQIKDLKQENAKLKRKLREIERAEKGEKKEVAPVEKVKKIVKKECPNCGAAVKSTSLPMGTLDLCESACGYRKVHKNE